MLAFLAEQRQYRAEFKTLVLRLYENNAGDIAQTCALSGISERTLCLWVSAWNEKKSLENQSVLDGDYPDKVSEEVFTNFRNNLLSLDKQHFTTKELYHIFKDLKISTLIIQLILPDCSGKN